MVCPTMPEPTLPAILKISTRASKIQSFNQAPQASKQLPGETNQVWKKEFSHNITI